MRILLVEDEPNLRQIISSVLAEEGHDVHTSPDGEAAITFLKEKRTPHLVITDFAMPRKSGKDVIEYCRKEHPTLPVILITGIVHQGLPEWEALGAVASLQKPFKMEELLALVKKNSHLKRV